MINMITITITIIISKIITIVTINTGSSSRVFGEVVGNQGDAVVPARHAAVL
ncbi:uncharacterized protein UV8b_02594 [Ustilaginoidea virens]|uniref:Uncharacterized protein n=1 Tax=Ustilaginoidea virens TaxID=1159556 RepID=A0A8E5HN74_USTVR|nr:uncharacterized protein UV8b_02594 [Ustilaginoidea virens]QUC18353.1 hypothetical protein UV8b_02594 [Ustilaginoidea virens]